MTRCHDMYPYYPYLLLDGVYELVAFENTYALRPGQKKYPWRRQIIDSHGLPNSPCSSIDCLNNASNTIFVQSNKDDLEPLFDEYTEGGDDLRIHESVNCAILVCVSCRSKARSLGVIQIDDSPCILDLDE